MDFLVTERLVACYSCMFLSTVREAFFVVSGDHHLWKGEFFWYVSMFFLSFLGLAGRLAAFSGSGLEWDGSIGYHDDPTLYNYQLSSSKGVEHSIRARCLIFSCPVHLGRACRVLITHSNGVCHVYSRSMDR